MTPAARQRMSMRGTILPGTVMTNEFVPSATP